MIRFLLIIFLLSPVYSWATEPVREGCSSDSSAQDSGDIGRVDLADDTLVFDDWELRDPTNVQQQRTDELSYSYVSSISTADHDAQISGFETQEEVTRTKVVVYPNPSSDWIQIEGAEQVEAIRLMSLDGKVDFISVDQDLIDIRSYSNGTYILQLVYGDRVESIKFVKN